MAKDLLINFGIGELAHQFSNYVNEPIPFVSTVNSFNQLVDYVREREQEKEDDPAQLGESLNSIGSEEYMPLTFSSDTEEPFRFALEPKVSVGGKNKIIRRYPSRNNKGGSIKERWIQDDFTIKIEGFLINLFEREYPHDQVEALTNYCHQIVNVGVAHPKLKTRQITRLSIESLEMPYTRGVHAQKYSIVAYSDFLFNSLLTEI